MSIRTRRHADPPGGIALYVPPGTPLLAYSGRRSTASTVEALRRLGAVPAAALFLATRLE